MLDNIIQKFLHDKATQEERELLDVKLDGIFEGILKTLYIILEKNPSLLPGIKIDMMIQYFKALPLSRKLSFYNAFLLIVEEKRYTDG